MPAMRLPGLSHRTVIIGRTGTGKTQAGLWHLSLNNFQTFPWVITDTKGDDMIREIATIPGVERLSLADTPLKKGLHILRATPEQMKSPAFDAFLARIHARGRCGVFIDEGYMTDPRCAPLNTILTQGRSLKVPVIFLTQRPAWVTKFAFSEADFFQCFHLNDREDQRTIEKFVPAELDRRLPDYHSLWYDVGRNAVVEFSPVPPRDDILDNFDVAIRPRKRVI